MQVNSVDTHHRTDAMQFHSGTKSTNNEVTIITFSNKSQKGNGYINEKVHEKNHKELI